MRDEGPRTPQAMRASVTDRLRALVKADPRLHLADLLRQFAYDRLLARIFTDKEADRWVLKGATALLARLGPEARHTRDVDLYAEAGDLDDAEAALRAVASRDLGDLFRFEVLPGTPAGAGSDTRGLRIIAYLGATEFARFPVDLVTHVNMTEEPDLIGPLVPVEVPGMVSAEYRVYPMVDHIADKVCAIHEMHYRLEGPEQHLVQSHSPEECEPRSGRSRPRGSLTGPGRPRRGSQPDRVHAHLLVHPRGS